MTIPRYWLAEVVTPHGPIGDLAKGIAQTVCNMVVSIFDFFPI